MRGITMKKDQVFSMKITEKEKEMLKNIREKHNINTSSLLRSCIIDKYDEMNKNKDEK